MKRRRLSLPIKVLLGLLLCGAWLAGTFLVVRTPGLWAWATLLGMIGAFLWMLSQDGSSEE